MICLFLFLYHSRPKNARIIIMKSLLKDNQNSQNSTIKRFYLTRVSLILLLPSLRLPKIISNSCSRNTIRIKIQMTTSKLLRSLYIYKSNSSPTSIFQMSVNKSLKNFVEIIQVRLYFYCLKININ
jgi:hypothetical protein